MHSSPAQRSTTTDASRAFRVIAMLLLLGVVAGFIGRNSLAADSGKTITLGESLNEEEKRELLDFFNAKPGDRVDTVTVADTKKAMKGILDQSVIDNGISSAYSSTALTCLDLGDGLNITTRNITLITPSMYAMALVTAGIGDGKLIVAAPNGAPAQGMTALTGVFKTWDVAPCDSGNTSEERQRIALEELALTVDIGQALQGAGIANGVQLAGEMVLEIQKNVVIEKLRKKSSIDQAVATQEAVQGVQIPPDLRNKLVDLMVRLAKQKVDWSTFTAGWTIEYTPDGTRITMKGDGIAIRNAQLTATARAADNMTATALAAADMTATAQAAALTATADAQPTSLPTPDPTPTPAPFTVTGTVNDHGEGQVWIKPAEGGAAVAYTIDAKTAILRDGQGVSAADLAKGDLVSVVIDDGSQHLRSITATPASAGIMGSLSKLVLVLPLLLIIPIVLILKRKTGEAFVVKRVAHA